MLAAATLLLCPSRRVGASRVSTARRGATLQAAALPLGFFMIALNTYNYIDTAILGVMRSDVEIGWYSAAYRIYEGLTYAPAVLAAVLTPTLSHLFIDDRIAHRRLLARALAAALRPRRAPRRRSGLARAARFC